MPHSHAAQVGKLAGTWGGRGRDRHLLKLGCAQNVVQCLYDICRMCAAVVRIFLVARFDLQCHTPRTDARHPTIGPKKKSLQWPVGNTAVCNPAPTPALPREKRRGSDLCEEVSELALIDAE